MKPIPAVAAVLDTLAECKHRSPPYTKKAANERLNHKETYSRSHWLTPSSHAGPKTVSRILSSGGMNSGTHLLRVLCSRMEEPLALIGLILDSCQDKGTLYWQAFDAIIPSFAKTIVWCFMCALSTHCSLRVMPVYVACRNVNPVTLRRRTPPAESGQARGTLYIFIREDRISGRVDIKPHTKRARRKVGGSQKYQLKGVGIACTCPWTGKGTLIELTR